jgi:hypothetical protein
MKVKKKSILWNKAGKPVAAILLIAIFVVVIPHQSWGLSNNMCQRSGCHGVIYEEYTDLLPNDPLSELPDNFFVNYTLNVNMAVEILGFGDLQENLSFFKIDTLMVNMTSVNGNVDISNSNLKMNEIFPYDKVVFQWSVKGIKVGADTLIFDLFSNNTHENPTTHDYYSYDITVSLGPPSQPKNFYAQMGDKFVKLTWEIAESNGGLGITGYNIYRNGTQGVFAFSSGNQLWFNDTNVVNGQTYIYNVSALNGIGEGESSESIEIVPSTAPSPPKNILYNSGFTFVHIFWSDPDSDGGYPIINYTIYRGLSPSGMILHDKVNSTTFDYNDTSAVSGLDYYYHVRAMNITQDESAPSEMISIPHIGLNRSTPPVNLVVSPGDGNLSLTWESPEFDGHSPITEYQIYRGPRPGQETFLTKLDPQITYFKDLSVINGLRYSYYLTANNSVGESDPSNRGYSTPWEGYGLPDVKYSSPAAESINLTVGEVAAFLIKIESDAKVLWYIDSEIYATDVTLITFASMEPAEHIVRVTVINETSKRSFSRTWNLTYSEEDEFEDDSLQGEDVSNIPKEWNFIIVLLGAVALVIFIIVIWGKYFRKKKS